MIDGRLSLSLQSALAAGKSADCESAAMVSFGSGGAAADRCGLNEAARREDEAEYHCVIEDGVVRIDKQGLAFNNGAGLITGRRTWMMNPKYSAVP